ncbi:hypothetical protein LUZ60_012981 [Juncus effusus]|nr:hypothetical protein LUZ60_012981 [Juncus effusus]
MASPPPNETPTPVDALFLQNLMSRLQLRPPYLDSNSFLTSSLDDLLLLANSLSDSEEHEDDSDDFSPEDSDDRRRALNKEEAKLEKEIVRIVQAGEANEVLKPNSGQSVSIGDHNICVGFHVDKESEYRVWEWHGHIMLFDDEEGYTAEYIYGNYFERLAGGNKSNNNEEKDSVSGLRDLINSANGSNGRVLHRNSVLNPNESA